MGAVDFPVSEIPAEANTGSAFSWAFFPAQYIPFIPQLLMPGMY